MTPDRTLAPRVERVIRELRAAPQESVYAVLDGARSDRVYRAVETSQSRYACLYEGRLSRELAQAAPCLVEFESGSSLLERLITEGWGEAWGVFASSSVSFEELRRHLRRFLVVQSEAGQRLLFRYYDPRVLRRYLPTCTAGELEGFFGPISSLATEAEDPDSMLVFSRTRASFALRRVDLANATRSTSSVRDSLRGMRRP